jgi:Uma2 family endonuclease
LDETREAYQQAGVSEIWFVDDEQKRLIIDRRQRGGVYREEVKTKGKVTSRVLSGFWLDVAWLWQDPLPNSFQCLQEILGAA